MRYLLLIIVLYSIKLKAQDISAYETFEQIFPIDVVIGDNSTMYQSIYNKDINGVEKLHFFNLVNFEFVYNESVPDYHIVQSLFYYDLFKGVQVGVGANFKSSGGFKPLLALSYGNYGANHTLFIQPSAEITKNGVAELFAIYEWSPQKESLAPYFNIQLLNSWFLNDKGHDFSYAYFKLGMKRKSIRFGPAFNYQLFGKNTEITNWGVFLGVNL